MKLLAWLAALLGIGCATTAGQTVHGIPNYAELEPGLARSGLPPTAAAWAWLHDQGYRYTIQLHFDEEAPAAKAQALAAGFAVIYLPLEPRDTAPLSIFDEPDMRSVALAVAIIRRARKLGVKVHWNCVHGADRSGLLGAVIRVTEYGWTKERAFDEALRFGYHIELPGLDAAWLRFSGELPAVTEPLPF